jgi:hypothetical protein
MEVKSTAEQSWSAADVVFFEEVYQLQATSRMNSLYYSERLRELQRISLVMEFLIAATASGSGITALASATSSLPFVGYLWKGLLLIAAIVSIIRPIYAPGKKIEIMTRQQHGYNTNFFALKKLAHNIRQSGKITDEMRRRFDSVFDRHVQLAVDDESAPRGRAIGKARNQAEQDLPRARFWWPFSELMPHPPERSSQDEVREERQREWPKLLLSKKPAGIAPSDLGSRDLSAE